MTTIKGSTGNGYGLKVDASFRAWTRSVTETEIQEATINGDAFNINTGEIGLTSSTASGILYFKNNETRNIVIDDIIVGVNDGGTVGTNTVVTLVRNPSAGTLISNASPVAANVNRNFASNLTINDSFAYKGAEGNTITDGDDFAYSYMSAGSRLLLPGISIHIGKGDSLGIKIDTQTTAGTTNVYAALALHLRPSV